VRPITLHLIAIFYRRINISAQLSLNTAPSTKRTGRIRSFERHLVCLGSTSNSESLTSTTTIVHTVLSYRLPSVRSCQSIQSYDNERMSDTTFSISRVHIQLELLKSYRITNPFVVKVMLLTLHCEKPWHMQKGTYIIIHTAPIIEESSVSGFTEDLKLLVPNPFRVISSLALCRGTSCNPFN
jgi:hypothetical protein